MTNSANSNELPVIETPVLFIIFNRLETALQVFEQIKKAQPKKLYIAADGPRANKPGEAEACNEVRKQILSMIDWDCQVFKLFRSENLGCKESISSAISWMFETEESGIILEDDCVPEVSFFEYCQTMLEKYKNNNEVMMVTGTNYIAKKTHTTDGVFFSRYFAIWGWATWKRAWLLYDKKMETWEAYKKSKELYNIYPYIGVAPRLSAWFEDAAAGRLNTWDYQWFYTCAKNKGMAVVPTKNLISNIGLVGAHASGKYSRFRFMKTEPITVSSIAYPKKTEIDMKQDKEIFTEVELVSYFFWVKLLIKSLRALKKKVIAKL